MVDVTGKEVTAREARAEASVALSRDAFEAARAGNLPKGELDAVVRLAGIMAAKRTAELIPYCHPLRLTHVELEVAYDDATSTIRLSSVVRCVDRTGVEMEALTACAVAGLAVIDMVKAVDPWATLGEVRVMAKSGGRSGARTRS